MLNVLLTLCLREQRLIGIEMIEKKFCKELNCSIVIDYRCDNCEASLLERFKEIPVTILYGYENPLADINDNEYHFCSSTCAIEFLETKGRKNEK